MSHKVIKDYGQGENPTDLSVHPYWVIAIFRQKNPATWKRSSGKSFTTDLSKGVEIFPDPLIIADDCFSLSVTNSKSNHVTSLNAGLYATEDYLQLINPGDWMFAWMVQKESIFKSLLTRIKEKKDPCNFFNDGLKFFGKVTTIRKQLIQNPAGPRMARYSMTGAGFTELDASLYYNPYLQNKQDQLATQFGRFGYDINDLIDKNAGGITANKAIPQILDVMLGKGVPTNLKRTNPDDIKNTYGTEGDSAYVLPVEVGTILNKTITSKKGGIGYADLVELLVGVQEYNQTDEDVNESRPEGPGKIEGEVVSEEVALSFQPKGAESSGSRRFTENQDLLGSFLPTPPQFIGKTVWNILREYINPACNELYSTLRVNPDGYVVPTIVARQLPFTTELARLPIPSTKFLSVPRWEIHPILIKSADYGRSDALRFNFIDVIPISSSAGALNTSALTVTFPPYWDAIDIARSGLRPYNPTINAYGGDTRNDSIRHWKDLITDILMGQHLTFSGTLSCVGIQSPICVGDNVEFDGIVFHIESVMHACSISPDGHKTFQTNLNLTNGQNVKQDAASDLSIYPHLSVFDAQLNKYDPSVDSYGTIKRGDNEKRVNSGVINGNNNLEDESSSINELGVSDKGVLT